MAGTAPGYAPGEVILDFVPGAGQSEKPGRSRNEAFAQAFLERLAGSQGRALSRVPQDTESPL